MLVEEFFVEHKRLPRFAIDGTAWLVEILKANREHHKLSFYNRILSYYVLGVQLVIVFDGDGKMGKLRYNMNSPTKRAHSDDIETFCEAIGIKTVRARAEGEAECARLQKSGAVDFVVTQDSDVLVYGATKIVRDIKKGQKDYIDRYNEKSSSMDKMVAIVEIDSKSVNGFLMLALMSGGDHHTGIKNIGFGFASTMCFPVDKYAKPLMSIYRSAYIENPQENGPFFALNEDQSQQVKILLCNMLKYLLQNPDKAFAKKANKNLTLEGFPDHKVMHYYLTAPVRHYQIDMRPPDAEKFWNHRQKYHRSWPANHALKYIIKAVITWTISSSPCPNGLKSVFKLKQYTSRKTFPPLSKSLPLRHRVDIENYGKILSIFMDFSFEYPNPVACIKNLPDSITFDDIFLVDYLLSINSLGTNLKRQIEIKTAIQPKKKNIVDRSQTTILSFRKTKSSPRRANSMIELSHEVDKTNSIARAISSISRPASLFSMFSSDEDDILENENNKTETHEDEISKTRINGNEYNEDEEHSIGFDVTGIKTMPLLLNVRTRFNPDSLFDDNVISKPVPASTHVLIDSDSDTDVDVDSSIELIEIKHSNTLENSTKPISHLTPRSTARDASNTLRLTPRKQPLFRTDNFLAPISHFEKPSHGAFVIPTSPSKQMKSSNIEISKSPSRQIRNVPGSPSKKRTTISTPVKTSESSPSPVRKKSTLNRQKPIESFFKPISRSVSNISATQDPPLLARKENSLITEVENKSGNGNDDDEGFEVLFHETKYREETNSSRKLFRIDSMFSSDDDKDDVL